jgi:hypothetical protein
VVGTYHHEKGVASVSGLMTILERIQSGSGIGAQIRIAYRTRSYSRLASVCAYRPPIAPDAGPVHGSENGSVRRKQADFGGGASAQVEAPEGECREPRVFPHDMRNAPSPVRA